MSEKRAHVFYSGSVQGVGFRFTASRLAIRYNLSGYVKNLGDGRVEMMLQGEEKSISLVLNDIRENHFSGYIRDTEMQWLEPSKDFTRFEVLF
ncbi:MAG: acylphosphatase [Candidatus Aureabacteria bacterium]|nr:acylphosphatase [Candidatus Auribacterota bacterium]